MPDPKPGRSRRPSSIGQGRDLIGGDTGLAVVALEMTNNVVRLLELAVATRTVDVTRLGRWDGRIDLGFVVLMEVVRLVVASETIEARGARLTG